MSTLIVHPDSKEKLSAIKAFMEALKISYEEKGEAQYSPEFVSKVLKGDQDLKEGKGIKIDVEALWK